MFRILLVDDDSDMRMIEQMWLKKSYEVETAGSGAEAIEILKHTDIDIVLLDYRMPGMDGAETLRAISEDPLISDVTVFFLTGEDDISALDEHSLEGAAGFIRKSGGKKALMEALEAYGNHQ